MPRPPQYPSDWDKRRRKVYRRDRYRCQQCSVRGGRNGNAELHAHHIRPLSRGGSNNYSNLITLCSNCHSAVHGRPVGTAAFKKSKPLASRRHNPRVKSAASKKSRSSPSKRRNSKYGSLSSHIIVFIFVGWWTAGLGNIAYALWKRLAYSSEPKSRKSEKAERRRVYKDTHSRKSGEDKREKVQKEKIEADDNANKVGNTPTETITIEVDYGSSWSGSVGDETSQRSVNGTGPKEFEINPNSMVAVATVQKQDDSINKMVVRIKQGSDIVTEGSTTAKYGVVSVNEPFYLRDLQLY